ncbi:MAG TPA: gfo/Idh/MocA family oxidoreductase, partial [Firmicutes bacterium]|nr:gfo/Idh/MocA family oxidoreductase [Bacillota bacterium]
MKSRIGIIGTGRRGKDHIRQLVKRDDVVVTAVCDIVREVAEEAARIAGA